MELEFELDMLMPKKFVDRKELKEIVHHAFAELSRENDYQEVLVIYGMGGIGKSRFLQELYTIISQNKFKDIVLIYTSLEIENDDAFHSLLRVRRSIPYSCYLFDYALVTLMDGCLIENINDDFFKKIKQNFLTSIVSFVQGVLPIPTPSLDDSIEILNQTISKIAMVKNQVRNQDIIQRLQQLSTISPKKVLNLLPSLLGFDLNCIAKDRKLVMILDSCSGKNGCFWIDKLLENTFEGLYILSSREQLVLKKRGVRFYHMEEIPAQEAEKYLKVYIREQHQKFLIPALISITEGIPIYLDMAVSIYLHYQNSLEEDLTDKLSFGSKEDLIRNFLDHLPDEYQNAILVLAVVGVFDEHIFNHLAIDLNLSVSKLDYHELCKISLVDHLNFDCELKTFHTIFQRSVSKIVSQEKKYQIFRSYLSFLSKRGISQYPIDTLWIFLVNILQLIIVNEFLLTIKENEEILDIFFFLFEQRVELIANDEYVIPHNKTLFTFLAAVSCFHSDAVVCLSKLESIQNSIDALGKHKNSYYAILYYSLGIKGQYSEIIPRVGAICQRLSANDFMDWYYGKLKIYYADYLMLAGNFREALINFNEYYDEISEYSSIKGQDLFEISKQKGHCYRFNFWTDRAEQIYNDLYKNFNTNSINKSYCMTCLCEIKCYFEPQYVIEHYEEGIRAAKTASQQRSQAKLCYALGIAYTKLRKFDKAKESIDKSIYLNDKCHYPAGTLFALIAKCYYSYAKNGLIPQSLILEIETLSFSLQVYGYLLLPVYLITNNLSKVDEIQKHYQWLDWEKTKTNYLAFIDSLH